MALCFFLFLFLFPELFLCLWVEAFIFCVWNIYFWDIFRFLLPLLDFTVFPCGFNCTNQRVLHDCVLNVFFCFVFNLWINIFHLMVWLHASSLHTFLFFPVNLSSLAHCDDVVFVIITIDLSKLFHCRKSLFFLQLFLFLCYCLQRQVLFCWFQININVIQVIWGVCVTILQPATRVQCGLFWACLQETPSFQLGQVLSIGRIYFTLVF